MTGFPLHQLHLSRRNLLTLLSKLDRAKGGDSTLCSILKVDTEHPKFPATFHCIVTAHEDRDYYYERAPGVMLPEDSPTPQAS